MVVVLTDGASSLPQETIKSAQKLHNQSLSVFVIGIGSSVNRGELIHIASKPSCLYVNYLINFTEFKSLTSIIVSRTCRAPVDIEDGGGDIEVGPGIKIQCRIKIHKNGSTIETQVQYPTKDYNTSMYFSKNYSPNPSHYDFKVDFDHQYPSHVYIPNNKSIYIYCYIEGKYNKTASINITIEIGNNVPCASNPCPAGTICKSRPIFGYVCLPDPTFTTTTTTTPTITTHPPSTSTYDCDANNPCIDENIVAKKFYWPHHQKTKYVQCSEWKQCWVRDCGAGTIWDQNLKVCV